MADGFDPPWRFDPLQTIVAIRAKDDDDEKGNPSVQGKVQYFIIVAQGVWNGVGATLEKISETPQSADWPYGNETIHTISNEPEAPWSNSPDVVEGTIVTWTYAKL